ncbi:MAG: AI-2E family transporter [Pseudomonadota bacterium]|nr:AI-2E family transporter [Pseudomonadota bacterium]
MPRLESQTRFWALAFAAFVGLMWILKPVLLPFVMGMAVSYFLNPVVNKLAHHKIPRWLGALIVLLGFSIIAGLIATLIFPLLQSQVGALVKAAPGYYEQLRAHYLPWIEDWLRQFDPDEVDKLRDAAGQSVGQAAGWLGTIIQQIVSRSFALIDILALMVITPVVAFYMLRDWPVLTAVIDSCFPRRHYEVIRTQLVEVNNTLSGFIRGQALVCLALGSVYTIGLTAVGLHYSAAIGITAGVLSFIPYVGTIFGWVASLLLASVQFDDWKHIGLVVLVFLIGHILEGYVLTPRLVGKRVHLHPVWILFALIAGAHLMGFTGVLIAVPTAAVIGVLTRFGLRQYKNSDFYKDPMAPTRL